MITEPSRVNGPVQVSSLLIVMELPLSGGVLEKSSCCNEGALRAEVAIISNIVVNRVSPRRMNDGRCIQPFKDALVGISMELPSSPI